MKKIFGTTVVGSFPYPNTPENMENAFLDQINAGINIPCYPQLISMIDQFLDPLLEMDCGIEKKGKMFYLNQEFSVPPKAFALNYGEFVLDFFKKFSKMKEKLKGWKACLTGPFTLAGNIIVSSDQVGGKKPLIYENPRAIMSEELLLKLAKMMSSIAKAYSDMGATIISMDEPTLGLIVGRRKNLFHEDDFIIDVLNKAIAPISKYSSIHVCGRISPRLRDILLSSNVRILDHEFTNGKIDGVFEKSMLEREDKLLAYGIIESAVNYGKDDNLNTYIESPELVEKRIQKALSEFGAENLIFKPDCGFNGLLATFGQKMATEIVRRKLMVMTQVIKKMNL